MTGASCRARTIVSETIWKSWIRASLLEAPQRRKLVEFFSAHPRDDGKALRVSRYLTEDPHVRFSVWNAEGVAEGAVSLDEEEAERLAGFLAAPQLQRPRPLDRLRALIPR